MLRKRWFVFPFDVNYDCTKVEFSYKNLGFFSTKKITVFIKWADLFLESRKKASAKEES